MAAAWFNGAWIAAQYPGYRRFQRALRQPRSVQEAILARYLRDNSRTEFGRRHQFGRIASVREYQDRVPLSTYEDYEPAIAKIRRGTDDVLTRARVRCLEPSSGSTRAAKLIPYTSALQVELGRAIGPWIVDLARSRPAVLGGPAYWSISPLAAPTSTATGGRDGHVPVGFESDSAYLGGWLRWLADRTLVPCDDLRFIQDIADFRRWTLLRLLKARGLRLISVWHPTFLTLLLDKLTTSWSALLDDLRRGIPPTDRIRGVRPDPGRARELTRLDPLHPTPIWPHLTVVSCWGDGQAAALLPGLQARLPDVQIQAKGLIATEAFVSLPFAGKRPLALRSHFFEFLDERSNPRTAWELAGGESYSVVVTTGGGLYRYQLRDRIVVEGFLHQTPCIRFLGKEEGISDLRGEKLSEGLVSAILGRLIPVLAPGATFVLLAPDTDGRTARYALYVAAPEPPEPALGEALEAELAANPNYALCVKLGQLLPATVEHVPLSAPSRYMERMSATGQRLGDIKPVALSPLTGWGRVFQD